MNFKITLKTNQSSRLEIIGCFLFFFFFLIASVAIAIVEKNIGMFFVILIFLPVTFVLACYVWIALTYPIIIINKNFFTIRYLKLFKKKYLWKDIINIEQIYGKNRSYGKILDIGSSYVVLELIKKNIEANITIQEYESLFIKIDTVSGKGDELKKLQDKSFKKMAVSYTHLTLPTIYSV